jgi:nitric oxide reductase NorD protein
MTESHEGQDSSHDQILSSSEDSKQPAEIPMTELARQELAGFPAPVLERYEDALEKLTGRLADETCQMWASEGLEIVRKTVRSWEAAAEFFEASVAVQRQLPSGQFLKWAKTGTSVCSDSPSLAVAYFKSSPKAMLRLRPRYIDDWANVCRAIYRGTWKSSALSCRLFENTPTLLETLSFEEFCHFGEFLEVLSRRSYDQAGDALSAGTDLFPKISGDVDRFLSLAQIVAEKSWRETTVLFDSATASLVELGSQHRAPLITLARRLAVTGVSDAAGVLRDGANTLNRVPTETRDRLLDMTDGIAAVSAPAAPEFLRIVPGVLERVTFDQMMQWHSEGVRAARDSDEAAISYFKLESSRSQKMLDSLSSSIELSRVREIILMYCLALTGRSIDIQAAQSLADKNIGWFEGELPTTEGTTIYMPSVINRYTSKEENFGFFKVISTHQVGHIEFGSFAFDFSAPSNLFDDLRPRLPGAKELEAERAAYKAAKEEAAKQPQVVVFGHEPPGASGPAADGQSEQASDEQKPEFLTDMSRFFDLFHERRLALDGFTILESSRIDGHVFDLYPGIRIMYDVVRLAALESRPDVTDLPAREALVEFMVRVSLGQVDDMLVPSEHKEAAKKLRSLIRTVTDVEAAVEDAAEAAIRAYSILIDVKNEELEDDEFEQLEPEDENEPADSGDDDDVVDPENVIQQFMSQPSPDGESGDEPEEGQDDQEIDGESEEDYSSPQDVDYRGEFKPELSQLLSQMQLMENGEFSETGEMEPITQEQLEEMMKNAPEMELEQTEGDENGDQQASEMLENLMKELQKRDPENQQFQPGPMQHVDEDGGPLTATEPDTYTYPEWDFRANEYKPDWCMIHEKVMTDGEPNFFRETLSDNASLLAQIKRQFELVIPEIYRKQKRLEDGEEYDLDAVLEAVIDLRVGVSPEEKLYWRRNKNERSVAVAFLLDMSASTAEAIDEAKKPSDDWGAPDDPVEYMVWLRSRRSEGMRRTYKRIVDVEKEGITLLVNSLEALGDTYGIFGFSGYGRENVEFYTIKDLDEKFTEIVPRRIDRIAPLHATRMGPAIRHTTAKLAEVEARSRFLFLISDGRPQDRGYSREGVEKEYAVHDTRQALVEARQAGITPFCLTVDKAGHDYMKTMMEDFSYEVLPDISLLPVRLPQLYRNLTT